MIKRQLVIVFLLQSCFCFSQSGENDIPIAPNKFELIVSPGVFIQKEIFTEFNVIIGKISDDFPPKMFPIVGVEGLRIGLETNFNRNDEFIIAPKLGYEISLTFFSIRLSALNYFKNNQSEFRILPEVGASLGGMFNLTYGYGISFKNSIRSISNHRLALSINLNKRLHKANIRLLGL